MATGRVNVGGGGGRLNIFTQLTEPSKKEGIWIKTSRAYKKAVVDENVFSGGEWIDRVAEGWPDLPADKPAYTTSVAVGNDVYFTTENNGFYKLNTTTKTYTKLTDTPIMFYRSPTAYVDGYIYFFGSGSPSTNNSAYRYKITSDTFESIANMPVSVHQNNTTSSAAVKGKSIYITLNGSDLFKYDTNTNIYEQIGIGVSGRIGASIASVSDFIYFFGGSSTSNYYKVSRYALNTSVSEELPNAPTQINTGQSLVTRSNMIYIIGGDGSGYRRNFYEFDTTARVYNKLEDVPVDFSRGSAVYSEGLIIILGGIKVPKNISVYSFEAKQYTNDDIIIVRTDDNTGAYKTELSSALPSLKGDKFTRLTTGFDDVYMYYDNDLHSLEAYYGDGTQWIKFKEA